jgi:hypothetical protein
MEKIEFQLGGKQYKLSRTEVEDAMAYVPPKAIEKYFVELKGRRYPPKQVLSAALSLQPIGFTTMAAKGILERVGIPVRDVKETAGQPVTESERLFESYLNASGLTSFEFQPHLPGASARPDFKLYISDKDTVLFEVKEFRPTEDDFRSGGGAYDPYEPIRKKIHDVMPQFKELKNECCALVLYNVGKPLVDLGWQFIYSAMLGNLSFRFPVSVTGRPIEKPAGEVVFGSGGEMLRHKDGQPFEPQKTRISSIIALQHLGIGKCRFEVESRRREMQMGRELTIEEYLDLERRLRGTESDYSLRQLRVIVCENPYAAHPFSRELFRGPYDERYGPQEGRIVRNYVGEQIAKLEEEQAKVGLKVKHAPIT